MNWDEVYSQGIDVESISRDSEEYQTMFSAAVHGIPSAQYCLGLWAEKVNKKPDVALTWLKKSAQQNFEEAIEALQRFAGEHGVMRESEITEEISSVSQPTSLVIREHNFQAAKNSLKKYTEQAKKDVGLKSVPTDGGLFNLGSHKVTGEELNSITSQIQTYLVNLNSLSQGIIDEFGEVYKAFESLDKDYISGIVASIKAAEEVSKQEQKDRKDIKELVAQHELSVAVLKKFKADIEKIKHLMDVDAAYELIEEQERLVKGLCDYRDELSALKHIKDVDRLWDAKESQVKALENINKKIDIINETIESQCNAISEFAVLIDQKYQSFVGTATKTLDEKQAAIDRRFDSREKAIQADFSDLRNSVIKVQEAQNNRIDDLSKSQTEKLFSIENAQAEKLGQIAENQSSALDAMKKAQDDLFAQISNEQSEILAQISREQVEWLESTNKSLEEEKASLKENITALTQKVKTAYIVAGGAAVVTVVHMVLSILGVL